MSLLACTPLYHSVIPEWGFCCVIYTDTETGSIGVLLFKYLLHIPTPMPMAMHDVVSELQKCDFNSFYFKTSYIILSGVVLLTGSRPTERR